MERERDRGHPRRSQCTGRQPAQSSLGEITESGSAWSTYLQGLGLALVGDVDALSADPVGVGIGSVVLVPDNVGDGDDVLSGGIGPATST